MKIDLEQAKKEFLSYTEKFDLENLNIKRKQIHSLRVMKISEEIAKKLQLDEGKIKIASLIGLLHDIARFKQFTEYNTFNDLQSIDHGNLGAEILNKDIRKYIEDDKYDKIIIEAVKNHNKFKIEDGLTDEELLFAKIIRDADKIDIIYQTLEIFWKNQEEKIVNSKINDKIYNEVMNKVTVQKRKNEEYNEIDRLISKIALVFDINFKESFEILERNDYINKIINRFEYKYENEKMQKIKNLVNEYIEEKVKG